VLPSLRTVIAVAQQRRPATCWFIVPMRVKKNVKAPHEPERRSMGSTHDICFVEVLPQTQSSICFPKL